MPPYRRTAELYLPVRPERLYQGIVAQIERRIVAGDLEVGDQLPSERDLAEQFAVSRIAVREAVKALCEEGLLEIRLGRGTFITNGTEGALRHSLGLAMRLGAATVLQISWRSGKSLSRNWLRWPPPGARTSKLRP